MMTTSHKKRSKEEIYQQIMEAGKKLAPFDEALKTEQNRVSGCQSIMYLHAWLEADKICFNAYSDALISAGLAAILIDHYKDKTPEQVLTQKPTFLEEWGIPTSLSPSRANGLASLYLKMKRHALHLLTAFQK